MIAWTLSPVPNDDQVRFYREQGYLKYGRLFAEEEMRALREHVDRRIAALPEGARPEGMDVPHFDDPWLFRYLTHPRVLDTIERFIGPDILLWSSHFIAKPGGDGKAVPWHTDGAYWGERLAPMEVITLWLAVDESSAENGCMRVIPGSHRPEVRATMDRYGKVDREANVFDAELSRDAFDESAAVDLELQPGECHFHDAWTVHGSTPNVSAKRRCGYTMRYMPAYVVHSQRGGGISRPHHIYLVRGKDRSDGRNALSPVPS